MAYHPAVLLHAVDHERFHEVDLHFGRWLEHRVGDAVVARDRAVVRLDGDVQVVERDVPPYASGVVNEPRSVSALERFGTCSATCRRGTESGRADVAVT